MRRRPNEGSVLIGVIIMLAVIGLGATAVWTTLQRSVDASRHREQAETARYLAESGLEHAVAALRADAAFTGATEIPLGDHRYSMSVVGQESDGFRIESTGEILSGTLVLATTTLDATLRLNAAGEIVAYTYEARTP